MVDDIRALLRPRDHRDHVIPEEISNLLWAARAQSLALLFDLVRSDRDLCGAQAGNGNRL